MKIKKLEQPVTDDMIVDKINEIIDTLNNSFITTDPDTTILNGDCLATTTCDTLTPLSNETIDKAISEPFDYIIDNSWITEDLFSKISCPHCGAKHFTVGETYSTAVYYPPIYKDGKNINKDCNKSTTKYYCLECNKTWEERT